MLPLMLAIAIGRVGCFLTGLSDHTYGVATRLPWGVDFGDGVLRHPTQLYEAFAEFVIFGLLWQRAGWKLGPGAQIGFYLVMYSTVRFGVEFVRSHAQGLVLGLSLTQWMSAGFVLLGAWYWHQSRGGNTPMLEQKG